MEPYVKLAFTMRDTPGAYAVLLGAGASIAAGMPSAGDVQENLIARLAAAKGDTGIGDPRTWYQENFGHPVTYDDLLAALTSTPYERQALLRSYFEPDAQEREDGLKEPSAAHRELARMVAAGHVRIVLTTNFDRLVETALREVNIEPVVVADAADAAGLGPLHTIRCLVIHVHGDYLTPTSMLNTPEELDHYAEDMDRLLDRVFTDYGLIISGWSATWDPALRNAIARSTTRYFASYWTDPRPLSEKAQNLLTHRAITYVQADADTFFTKVAEAAAAVTDTKRRHPASIDIAVAVAKRALDGFSQGITLHDTLRREIDRIAALPLRTTGPWNVGNRAETDAEHGRRLVTLETEMELLLTLVAVTAYWGSNTTDRWWLRDIEQLGAPHDPGGDLGLMKLVRAPATMMIYAAGIAALANERWDTLAHVLTEPRVEQRVNGKTFAAAALLSPWETLNINESSKRVHYQLRPIFIQHLALSETAYVEAWERFEYLRVLVESDADLYFSPPHIKPTGYLGTFDPAPAAWLKRQIDQYGDNIPVLREGLLDGSPQRLDQAAARVKEDLDNMARQMRYP